MLSKFDGAPLRRALVLLVALLLAVGMVACGDDEGDEGTNETTSQDSGEGEDEGTEEETEGAGDVTVVATEYSFDLPATLPAGEVSFTLQNDGEQAHHLIMAKLSEDAPSMEKLIKMRDADKFLEEDLTGNKPPMAKPGETSTTSIDTELTPGTYGYVCFLPDKEKKQPHAFLGMNGTFTVE